MEEFSEVLLDVQKEYKRSNKLKDIIIIILIVLMFLQSAFSFGCFVWYESQFDYVTTNGKDVDVETSGDNANAEYNDVSGNQYNDNAVHNQGGENQEWRKQEYT
jgi:hypothetical protein